MAKYRKKPVVIDAVQWTGDNYPTIKEFVGYSVSFEKGTVAIHTIEGKMQASHLDYIIKGVQGEFYPCKPDIFERTYEKVE